MRKCILIIACLLLVLCAASWLAWASKANILAQFLSRHMHVPVTIQTFDLAKTSAEIDQFLMGNPPRSKTASSFSAQTTAIKADMTQILANPLIIDQIEISNIFVGVEYYKDGSTNWDYILKTKAPKKQGRDYLIRTLVLENLTVEVTSADGKTKRYPTLKRMEFHNISSASGFPIAEIEKAIFKLVMQDIFKQFDLLQKLPINSPIKYLPNLLK